MSKQDTSADSTHFGYRSVPVDEKAGLVRDVFDSVADRYDIMNDLMSAGLHRLWKRYTVEAAAVRPGQRVLDLAGGTGDLTGQFARRVGSEGLVVLADINAAMLERGRQRLVDAGVAGNLAIARRMPRTCRSPTPASIACRSRSDCATSPTRKRHSVRCIAFSPRAGWLLVLEFSKPVAPLRPAYDLYSFNVLPLIGKFVARDEDSYRYLAESIRMHPDQETLLGMMRDAGFERCRYRNLAGGIVALHTGYHI